MITKSKQSFNFGQPLSNPKNISWCNKSNKTAYKKTEKEISLCML